MATSTRRPPLFRTPPSPSLRGALATKQSRLSSWLSGLPRFARNDGGEDSGNLSPSLRGAPATKQSRLSSWLSGLPRFARNDGGEFGADLSPSLRGALATKQSDPSSWPLIAS